MKKTKQGFSLIEVLVALVVLTVGVTAALSLSARNIDNAFDLQSKTIAHWVAQNEMARLSIQPALLNGNTESQVEMAGRTWYWQREIEKTFDDSILRVTIRIFSDKQRKQSVTQLIGYLPSVPAS